MLILERLMKTTQDEGQLAGMQAAHKEIKHSIQLMDNATRAHRSLRSLVSKCQVQIRQSNPSIAFTGGITPLFSSQGLEWKGLVIEHQSLIREGDGLVYGQGSVRLFLCRNRLFVCVPPEPESPGGGSSPVGDMRSSESSMIMLSSQKPAAKGAFKWRCISEVSIRGGADYDHIWTYNPRFYSPRFLFEGMCVGWREEGRISSLSG